MRKLILALSLIPNVALAQQANPQVQALSDKLMQELSSSIACSTSVIALQRENAALKEENTKLKTAKDNNADAK